MRVKDRDRHQGHPGKHAQHEPIARRTASTLGPLQMPTPTSARTAARKRIYERTHRKSPKRHASQLARRDELLTVAEIAERLNVN
jgi:hypothetical protein